MQKIIISSGQYYDTGASYSELEKNNVSDSYSVLCSEITSVVVA